MENYAASIELLNRTHDFPTHVMLKVIGVNDMAFVARVVAAVREGAGHDVDPPYRTRVTPNRRHIAITLEPLMADAEEVLAAYARLRTVEGVVMMM